MIPMENRPKISDRNRRQLANLPPEKRAAVEAILLKHQTPEYREREMQVREAIAKEIRDTGKIALESGRSVTPILPVADPLIASLKAAREAAGLSMAEVSRMAGIDLAALSRIENGQNANPTLATIRRYLAAVGKSMVIADP